MKIFIAKKDSKVNCVFCDQKMRKGQKRVLNKKIYKEEGELFSERYYYHFECALRRLNEKQKQKLISDDLKNKKEKEK